MSMQIQLEASAKFPMHTTHGTDHKAWAKRILHRLERGDKSLLAVQIQFAKMALNIKDEVAA